MPATLIRCAFCSLRVLPSEVVHTPRPAHPVCADHWYRPTTKGCDVSDAFTYSNSPSRRDAMIEYRDGQGREVELRVEEPNEIQVNDLLSAFVGLCERRTEVPRA